MKKALFLTYIAVSVVAIPGFAASFSCEKASAAVEKLICSDAALSKLDEQLSDRYKKELEISDDSPGFKAQQLEWLKKTRNVCGDVACLMAASEKRISDLEEKIKKDSVKKTEIIDSKPSLLEYFANYKQVNLYEKLGRNYSSNAPRPANSFKLVAKGGKPEECALVLEKFNQPGSYIGADESFWWINNESLAKWEYSDPNWKRSEENQLMDPVNFLQPIHGYQFLIGNLDSSEGKQYVFRVSQELSSYNSQELAIFDVDISHDKSVASDYVEAMCSLMDKNSCIQKRQQLDKSPDSFLVDLMTEGVMPIRARWRSRSGLNEFQGWRSAAKPLKVKNNINELSFVNLLKVNNHYGIFFYPYDGRYFEIHYFSISRDGEKTPECILAPNF